MKISIVVPVYKVEAYLAECVESVLAQDFSAWELILVDDGSPDRCGALCDAWAEKDPRITVIHRRNGGLSAARNSGIRVANGEYVLLLDSDDWLLPGALLRMAECAAGNDLVIFDYARFSDDGTREPEPHSAVPAGVYHGSETLGLLSENRVTLVIAWTKLYRRALFEKVLFPEGVLNEDEFTAHRFLAECGQVTAIADALYAYRDRPGSIMNALSPYQAAYVLHAFSERIALLREKGLTQAARKQEENFYHIYRYRYPPLAAGSAKERARAKEIRALYLALYPQLRQDGILAGADRAKAFALRWAPGIYSWVYTRIFKEAQP